MGLPYNGKIGKTHTQCATARPSGAPIKTEITLKASDVISLRDNSFSSSSIIRESESNIDHGKMTYLQKMAVLNQ
jgi:hypothetical protein